MSDGAAIVDRGVAVPVAVATRAWIVIPAYNEAENLPGLIAGLRGVLEAHGLAFGILVVNDGSRDNTALVARRFGQGCALDVLEHPRNMGVGEVFRTGLRAACQRARPNDAILIMEGDGTSDAGVVPAMVQAIRDGSDVVIASRYRGTGRYDGFPLFRLVLSVVANWLMRWRFRIPGVRDYTIFFRAYRAGLLQRAFEQQGPGLIPGRTFACNAALLAKLQAYHPRITEVPLVYQYGRKRGRSKLAVHKTVAEYLPLLWVGVASTSRQDGAW